MCRGYTDIWAAEVENLQEMGGGISSACLVSPYYATEDASADTCVAFASTHVQVS